MEGVRGCSKCREVSFVYSKSLLFVAFLMVVSARFFSKVKSSFLMKIDQFFDRKHYCGNASDMGVWNCNLSGNLRCNFAGVVFKAIVRPNTCFWIQKSSFGIGNYKGSGGLHLMSKKMRSNSISQGSSGIVYIYAKPMPKVKCRSKMMNLALLW